MISVIIPTYKSRGGLCKSIDSVLDQTYKDVEIIVVDDNNPNTPERKSTEELMSAYADNPRVKYIKHEVNKNGSAARNTGFRASHGEYINFLDDDDYWMPEKLEKQITYLQEHPEYDGVYTYVIVGNCKNPNNCLTGNIVKEYLMNIVSLQTSCQLLTRKAVEALNGFDESFRRHQDYEFMIRFFLKGFKIGCIPEYLSVMVNLGGNRVSGEKLDELKEQFFAKFEEPLNILDKQEPGIKKKIIVANYVKNFESHIAGRRYFNALKIFYKYFFVSPTTFVSQLFMLYRNHKKRKQGKV
ncbi:MAG: glycosyltransferase family 2 protein [Prevotella sp.]|nr:glycosyltransferase family 2 protein [Candidatus Prevotella equi]